MKGGALLNSFYLALLFKKISRRFLWEYKTRNKLIMPGAVCTTYGSSGLTFQLCKLELKSTLLHEPVVQATSEMGNLKQ